MAESGEFTSIHLSASTDGIPIVIAATAIGSADNVHASGASGIDFVTLYANNTSVSNVSLTLTLGGATSPYNVIVGPVTIAANRGPVKLLERHPISNSQVLKGFAGTTNVISLHGSVARLTE